MRYNSQYNDYEINYELIEEKMTDKFLRNKKLFNDDVIDFIYKFDFIIEEDDDIISKFNKLYMPKQIYINEKILLNKFYNSNKENINLQEILINDFKFFLNHLISMREKEVNAEGTKRELDNMKIIDVLDDLKKEEVSDEFKKMFEETEFTIDKTTNIFEYYLMLAFSSICNEIKKYQIEIDDKKKDLINKYFEKKDILITKEILTLSIRLFISLVLYNKENKEKAIKENTNNLINYLS